ncbi:trafficking protein particle complex subunit 5-like isoform X4 [Varroa jacobsoni]|uniref:Trafficking protein particle complex subunit 5 n=1 Tax=Varroa destructor TaxID=109461 RepID=A0A7M7M8Z8_VARDE|nr:trafficking protein particle complex subunit 5-like [Varroa destructor]XP_022701458.1 trafficking protein particle complex subunit 5-like isoform X4 [Varroa jacobsoni]
MNIISSSKNKVSNVDKPLIKPRSDIHISLYGLLFSEVVQYCQNRASSVSEIQAKLADLGQHIGQRVMDVQAVRDKNFKRETKLIQMLIMIKSTIWKNLFGKEADKLEQANGDDKTYYIVDGEPLVNRFISMPKDLSSLNCAYFMAGIVEAIMVGANFPCKVTALWHDGGTTFIIKLA